MLYRLGRLPRARNPRIPHLASLIAGIVLPPSPASVDYTTGMPSNLLMYGNDRLGDCTCAAVMHAIQVWSFNAQKAIDSEPEQEAVQLYEECCGYNPADPSTDQGGVEQEVLAYLLNTGAPMGSGGRHKIAAFVEVDPRNTEDVKRTIDGCGVCYIGFNVPTFLMASGPPAVWDVDPSGDQSIEGGHAVVLCGYDANGVKLISWGRIYSMTWAFFSAFCDEAYAIADPGWIEATGKTPGGLSLADLEAQMEAIKAVA